MQREAFSTAPRHALCKQSVASVHHMLDVSCPDVQGTKKGQQFCSSGDTQIPHRTVRYEEQDQEEKRIVRGVRNCG